MTQKIGEDFIVAADDIREMNAAFPGILQGMEYLDAMTPLVDEQNKVMAIKRFDLNGNEVVALYNFGDRPLENYGLNNPMAVLNNGGQWKETINSNDIQFDGTGAYQNDGTYCANNGEVRLNIPANGFVVLEKVDGNGNVEKGQPRFS